MRNETLVDWAFRNKQVIHTHKQGARYTYDVDKLPYIERWYLYHLKDYAVSTVSGPVTWLIVK